MKTRLLAFIKSRNVSQNAFEDNCGLTRGTVTKLNLGFRTDKLAQIARTYPELNLRWLLLGEGPMLLEDSNDVSSTPRGVSSGAECTIHNVFVTNFADMKAVMIEAIKESRK